MLGRLVIESAWKPAVRLRVRWLAPFVFVLVVILVISLVSFGMIWLVPIALVSVSLPCAYILRSVRHMASLPPLTADEIEALLDSCYPTPKWNVAASVGVSLVVVTYTAFSPLAWLAALVSALVLGLSGGFLIQLLLPNVFLGPRGMDTAAVRHYAQHPEDPMFHVGESGPSN